MSFQKIDEALDRAFELIEADQLDEARAILKPILDVDKDNPDVWWLYAHAVADSETARLALNNVQRLDPNYLNTGDLLYALENRPAGGLMSAAESGDKEPSFLPPLPSTLPDLPQAGKKSDNEEDDGWDAFEGDDEDQSVPLFRRPVFLMVAGLIIFLIIAALVILNPQPQTPSVSETVVPTDASSVAQVPTLESATPTAENPTLEPTTAQVESTQTGEDNFDNIVTALSAFELPDEAIATTMTSLGDTLVVSICTEAGAALRQSLPQVIETITQQIQNIPVDLSGAGVRMTDCTTDTTLLFIGVPSEDIQAYRDGSMNKETFQAKWQPLN